MKKEFKLIYTQSILRRALNRYFSKLIGPLFPILYFFISIFTIYRIISGDKSWMVGALAAVIIITAFIMTFSYIHSLKRVKETFISLQSGDCIFSITEFGISYSSPLGTAEIPWKRFISAKNYDDFILLDMGISGYTSIPVESIDTETINYLISRINTKR